MIGIDYPLVNTLFIEDLVNVVSEGIALVTLMVATKTSIADGYPR